jgi:hypothetical protein
VAVVPVIKKAHKPKPKSDDESTPAPVAEAKPCVFFCGNAQQ